MKTKLTIKLTIIPLALIYCASLLGQTVCPNRALHFNPIDSIDSSRYDFIRLDSSPISGNDNFTFETWFFSDATSACDSLATSADVKHLFSLGSTGVYPTHFVIRECGGRLNIGWRDTSAVTFFQNFGSTNSRGEWHHIAVTRDSNQVQVYLNGQFVFDNKTLGVLNTEYFLIGAVEDSVVNDGLWQGKVDEIRLWNKVRTGQEIRANKDGSLLGTEEGLQVYWPLNQGIPEADNSTIATVRNESSTGNIYDGVLHGFTRRGSTSNFVCADYNLIDLAINTIPFTSDAIREFGAGESVHFCLDLPTENSNRVLWQYREDANWIDVDTSLYSLSCGPILPGNPMIAIDCNSNTAGHITREFRALITTIDSLGRACDYLSKLESISICCPINEGRLEVLPNRQLCEGDSALFSVSYFPNPNDLFLNQPIGATLNIEWFLNGRKLDQHNQTSFTLNTIVEEEGLCFRMNISNCANQSATFSTCIERDLRPVPGSISAIPASRSSSLTQINDSPKEYLICPRDEAVLVVNDGLTNCRRVWEYSFNQLDWFILGQSNARQNTNQLPGEDWPATATAIYYRVNCSPSLDSSCEPAISNTLKIGFQEPPTVTSVIGESPICSGSLSNLTLAEYNPRQEYIWFHDGKSVGTGANYLATEPGCYFVQYIEKCYLVQTRDFYLEVCEIEPTISCPMTPNNCACLGEPITLSGCESIDNCRGNLVFDWTWDSGTLVQEDGCFLEHIPAIDGTTYTLAITNTLTGCTEANTRFIKPCDKP